MLEDSKLKAESAEKLEQMAMDLVVKSFSEGENENAKTYDAFVTYFGVVAKSEISKAATLVTLQQAVALLD